jgi:hypothetical protein
VLAIDCASEIEGNSAFETSARFEMMLLPFEDITIMALQLRPNCEYCDKDLPPHSTEARICSYECTFCMDCATEKLGNVCPNCGGGFTPRPIRPAQEWRAGLSVAKRPPSDKRVHLSYSLEDIAAHSKRIRDIPPEGR